MGCVLSCTVEISKNVYQQIELTLGIPEYVSSVEDYIFAGLENEEAKLFHEKFLESINVGADLSDVYRKFNIKIQKENLNLQVKQSKKYPELKNIYDKVIKAIQEVIRVYEENALFACDSVQSTDWFAVRYFYYSKYSQILLKILKKTR